MTINLTDVNEPGTVPGTAHCNATERLELWCASLTVGTGTIGGTTFYGASHLAGFDNFGGYGTTSRVFSYRTAQISVIFLRTTPIVWVSTSVE